MTMPNTKYPIPSSRGFTLIELLVSIGIFAVLTGVVLSNYRSFSTNSDFNNTVEDVYFALREAQVYGVGAKTQGGSFATAYGVHAVSDQNQISLFADMDSNGKYDLLAGDILIETIKWNGNIRISSLHCDTLNYVSLLSVTFRRPNPDAVIWRDGTRCSQSGQIVIKDTITNKTATTIITTAGQISLQ